MINKPKTRILHVLHGLPIGGAELLLVNYIKALGTDEYDHFVFSFGADGPVRKILEDLGVPVHLANDRDTIRHPIRFVRELSLLIFNLIFYIRTNDIDLIQSHTGHSNELAMLVGKICKVPTFPTIHSTKPFLRSKSRLRIGAILLNLIDHILFRSADQIISVSFELSSLIQQKYGVGDSKILVLKNGICEDDKSQTILSEKDYILFPRSKFNVIAVGRLVSLKSFNTLIESALYIKKKGYENFNIVIVGDGPDYQRLNSLINDYGLQNHVKLYGLSNNVVSLLKTSNAFVIPSKYEGLSMAMIEAMACELPIIASNAPGLRDHIHHNKNGLLFPVQDASALADTIYLLAHEEELQKKLSKASKEQFEKHYNMKKNIELLVRLFKRYNSK
jgi:glycosyltransferase involved in cell wall biosynthesis